MRVGSTLHPIMMFALVISLLSAFASTTIAAEPSLSNVDDAEFFYMAEAPFVEGTKWETSLQPGYIFSDPYLNIATATASAYYMKQRGYAFGVELTGYSSWQSRAAQGMDSTLGDYGFASDQLTNRPVFGAVGVMRLTPMTGMLNFFSSRVVMTDISFLLRGGTVKYANLPLSPVVGTGVLIHLGFSADWGVDTALIWDFEHPANHNWQSRVGCRIGPTFRF